MITKALVVSSPGDIRATEVLVQIVATGVCHTDINFGQHDIEGMFPAILGHEGRGWDGSKAYGYPPGEDESSETKITSHFFGQSCFSSYAVVDERCCIKVGEPGNVDLDLSSLAPLGCGILTGAGAMLNVLKPSQEDIVCIVGAGAVGLAAIMALNFLDTKPKQVIAVDIVDDRLELAKRYGATHVINSTKHKDLPGALKRVTNFEGIDVSIDATGRSEVIGDLLEATAKLGTVCSVGVGKFPFTDLITRYDAADMETAKADILSGKVVKAVLTWGAPGN
ncbi:hypothetical protein SS1G_02164 [Sclerotinia sclerotiorum 1980 UF-70]|uniref:Enoyl reductase (ER) domain-containing protein n=1 Tax=Sclerotinia sclerotiorum (strain ATCC 18683 / 1980 / Ss-1) TaxID=665079 RepID=A7EA33_SCLS1|nr:hypothetical protein SS1G_02164 [Sclerotinia sclerotiorum 1980 UF-70]EDN99311.1 hypothetical protein SS1G_02164 [Sclerotinia sclerotiorum 1980 UF-70]